MSERSPDEKGTGGGCSGNTSNTCCRPDDGKGSSCCSAGGWGKGKAVISAIIIIAAVGVGANSIMRGTSAQADTAKSFSAVLNEKSDKPAEGTKDTKPSADRELISFNRVLDSLQAIDTLAADREVVFIALSGKGQEVPQATSRKMEGVLGKLPPSCQKVAAFTLNTGASDYDRLVQRLDIKTFPCFVALGRQGSPAVIPAVGDFTEAEVLKAVLVASKSGSCCPTASKAICCPN